MGCMNILASSGPRTQLGFAGAESIAWAHRRSHRIPQGEFAAQVLLFCVFLALRASSSRWRHSFYLKTYTRGGEGGVSLCAPHQTCIIHASGAHCPRRWCGQILLLVRCRARHGECNAEWQFLGDKPLASTLPEVRDSIDELFIALWIVSHCYVNNSAIWCDAGVAHQ